jgi:type IV pilus assembly protein PilE
MVMTGIRRTASTGRRARGFTLIELMIVVSIVAILLAIGVPMYGEQVRKSRRAAAKSDMLELVQRLERWHTVNNTFVGFSTAVVTSPSNAATPAYRITPSALTQNTYLLTAVPEPLQADDQCGTLTINQANVRTESGANTTVAQCW